MARQHLYTQVPSIRSQVCPQNFNPVADFLAWILFCNGMQFVLHYLDDFLVIAPPGSALAAGMRSQVETIFDYVRAPIAHHKTEGPSTVLTFLGIQVDTNLSQLSLPLEKVARLREILSRWQGRKSCTKDLQILLGHLSHAAIVIRPGRIFLRMLFSLLSCLVDPCHYTHQNLGDRTDIAWW